MPRTIGLWPLIAVVLALSGCNAGTVPTTSSGMALGVSRDAEGVLSIVGRRGLVLRANLQTGAAALATVQTAATAGTRSSNPNGVVAGDLVVTSPDGRPPVVTQLTPADFDTTTGKLIKPIDLTGLGTHNLSLFLHDSAGRLVGSAVKDAVPSTVMAPDLAVTWNRETARVLSAEDGSNVADGIVIKSSTLDMRSGIADNQPGVDHVVVEISGPAYGDGTEIGQIATFHAPSLQSYAWQPEKPSGTFDPAKLVDGSTTKPFVLTTRSFDVNGRLVGIDTLRLSVIGTASVGVDFTDPTGSTGGTRIVAP